MTIEDDLVINRLAAGMSPSEIMLALHISRGEYYSTIERLTNSGIFARFGDLPTDAVTEVSPHPESVELIEAAEDAVDAIDARRFQSIAVSVIPLQRRYGMLPPPSSDRYTRSQWTGQAARRVDFLVADRLDGSQIMVVGLIVPRQDKKTWTRATPTHRVVHVTNSDESIGGTWLARRGEVVTPSIVKWNVSTTLSERTSEDLTKCVAWVCESRALFIGSWE